MMVARRLIRLTPSSRVPSSPRFQILIHIGNGCIHTCLDYTALLSDYFFFLHGSRAQGVTEGREGGSWKVFPVPFE